MVCLKSVLWYNIGMNNTIIKRERFKLISTVSLVLIDKQNNILLLRRHGTGWYDGHYAFVAGCVDGNETVVDAVIREAKEEANIILQPEWLTMATVVHRKMAARPNEKADSSEAIDFYFTASQWQGTITNNEPHKHDELGFFPLDNLPEPIIPSLMEGLESALKGVHFGTHGWDVE